MVIVESKTCKECGDKLDEMGACPGCGHEESSSEEDSEENESATGEEGEADENY